MTAHPPVRMSSSEWVGKDRPVYFRSSSSQLRYQASASEYPFARDAVDAGSIPFVGASVPPSEPPTFPTNPFTPSSGASAPSTQVAARPINTSILAAEAPASSSNTTAPAPEAWVPTSAASPASLSVRSLEPKDAMAESGVKNSVGFAIESVSETVKPYLPESIAAYLPTSAAEKQRTFEFPSKETPSGSNVGIGSLPGNVSETSVAKLPLERAMESRQKASHQKYSKSATRGKTANIASTSPGMYQNAKNYFRRSLGAYFPGDTPSPSQLPSKETPGGSAVGVGSLPGNTSEVSVAKLPEERRLETMPSHETDQEVLGKSGGVGALPGGPNESCVAMLPEERIHPQYDAGPTAMYVGASGIAFGSGSLINQGETVNQSLTIERDHEGNTLPRRVHGAFDQQARETGTSEGLGTAQTGSHASGAAATGIGAGAAATSATGAAHHASSNQNGYAGSGGTAAHPDVRLDPGYHPAKLHPLDPKFQQERFKVPSSSPDTNAGNTNRHSSVSAESEGHSSTSSGDRRKIGFMNKMKGEVKVISGKLSHNEKKIEEGKQMMGK